MAPKLPSRSFRSTATVSKGVASLAAVAAARSKKSLFGGSEASNRAVFGAQKPKNHQKDIKKTLKNDEKWLWKARKTCLAQQTAQEGAPESILTDSREHSGSIEALGGVDGKRQTTSLRLQKASK